MRAQIERARHFGVPFTHFDAHMDTLRSTPELTQAYADLGREYGVPILGNKSCENGGAGRQLSVSRARGPAGKSGRVTTVARSWRPGRRKSRSS